MIIKPIKLLSNDAFLVSDWLCRCNIPRHRSERRCWEKPCADGGSLQEVVLTIATVGITYLSNLCNLFATVIKGFMWACALVQ